MRRPNSHFIIMPFLISRGLAHPAFAVGDQSVVAIGVHGRRRALRPVRATGTFSAQNGAGGGNGSTQHSQLGRNSISRFPSAMEISLLQIKGAAHMEKLKPRQIEGMISARA